jgi:hypothetical protein
MSERNKCGCGNTKDENGYCDGSHMNIVKEDRGETDGLKAKVSWNPEEIDGWHNLDVEAELKDVLEEDMKNILKEEIKKTDKK